MSTRNRNTAILLIITGGYFMLGQWFGFLSVSAVVLIWLGLYKIRSDGDTKGYIVLVVGAILLLGNHLSVVVALVLISLGYFYIKSKRVHKNDSYAQKQTIIDSIRWDREPWVPKSMSRWHILGEVRIDLSLAMQDEDEVTIMLQGVLGDAEIIVPMGFGVAIESNVLFGRIGTGEERETGLLNKRLWESPHYAESAQKLKLIVSYAVGDIEVKQV